MVRTTNNIAYNNISGSCNVCFLDGWIQQMDCPSVDRFEFADLFGIQCSRNSDKRNWPVNVLIKFFSSPAFSSIKCQIFKNYFQKLNYSSLDGIRERKKEWEISFRDSFLMIDFDVSFATFAVKVKLDLNLDFVGSSFRFTLPICLFIVLPFCYQLTDIPIILRILTRLFLQASR